MILAATLSGCGTTAETAGAGEEAGNTVPGDGTVGPAAKYQHVGTYEHFATPIGSAVSVLMVDGKKIKLTDTDDTRYVNITVNNGIPEMRLSGTYGINGDLEASSFGNGEIFIVREIEHLGGGQDAPVARNTEALPDFFTVDGDARGPLTLSELQITFPDALARFFNSEERECFYEQVEWRAADLGDPLTMPPIRRVLLTNRQMRWDEMTAAEKRLQLARYVTSMALSAC